MNQTIEIKSNEENAQIATEIYNRKYRKDHEKNNHGHYIAIEIKSEQAYISEFPSDAMISARESNPDGMIYVFRIGYDAAFRVGVAH